MFNVIMVKAWLSFRLNSANSGLGVGAFPAAVAVLASASGVYWGGKSETTVSKSFSFRICTNLNLQAL